MSGCPLFLLLAVLTALGVGLWLSALNALYRDVRYVVPFLVQFWMFASPVAYPSSLVPGKWRWLYGLNPMAGVIEGFRWALTGHGQPPGMLLAALRRRLFCWFSAAWSITTPWRARSRTWSEIMSDIAIHVGSLGKRYRIGARAALPRHARPLAHIA